MEEVRTRRALEALQDGLQSVRIVYENGEGEVSQRSIVPLEFYERWNHHYVRAYCYLRHERRTFALRRMKIVEPHAPMPVARPAAGPTVVKETSMRRPVETATPAEVAVKNSRGFAEFFRLSLTIAGLVVVLWALLSPGAFSEYLSGWDGGSRDDGADSSQASYRDSKADDSGGAHETGSGDTPPSPPTRWTYRGYHLARTSSGRITSAQAGRSFDSGRQAHYWINSQLFYKSTGLSDSRLLARYMGADTDRNGHLSWREVEAFQRQTYRLFTYRSNHHALPPDDFLAQRGGDCEDFALYTCGMLEFWGWNSKVASFYPPETGNGHAIAMVWSASPIKGYGYIHVSGGADQSGSLTEAAYTTAYLRPGYWIPIDYDSIGRFSTAMSDNWTLWDLNDPVDLYGAAM